MCDGLYDKVGLPTLFWLGDIVKETFGGLTSFMCWCQRLLFQTLPGDRG